LPVAIRVYDADPEDYRYEIGYPVGYTQEDETALKDDDDEDDEDDEDDDATRTTRTKRTAAQIAEDDAKDQRAILSHFTAFLESKAQDVNKFREPTDVVDPPKGSEMKLCPMYVGALNRRVVGDLATLSFVPAFLDIARQRFQKFQARGGRRRKKGDPSDFGLAILLFTSQLKTAASLQQVGLENFEIETSLGENDNLVAFVFDEAAPKSTKILRFHSAGDAIQHLTSTTGIRKFAVLGYGMLSAGLTLQTTIPIANNVVLNFVPAFLAFCTTPHRQLDLQLQLAGRSFVDLRRLVDGVAVPVQAPSRWRIELLAPDGLIDSLRKYAAMEASFANAPNLRLFEATHRELDVSKLNELNVQTVGTITTLDVDIGTLLGQTCQSLSDSGGTELI